jgi:hypothetical protein
MLPDDREFSLDDLMTVESAAQRWPRLFTAIELRRAAPHGRATSGTFTKAESASFRNAI